MKTRIKGVQHLNQDELALRWNISPRSLERWRWLKHGPTYLKIGGRVAYRMEDVLSYEASSLCHIRLTGKELAAVKSNAAAG